MRLRPLQDRVLIRRAEPEARSAGGIFIPDMVREKPVEARSLRSASAPATRPRRSRQGRRDRVDEREARRPRCCSPSGPAPRSSSTAKN
ncbi:MAG TPA: hypothetical protein VM782_02790 [Stellaceae bacterium]|nr:hypothetical protein [Stellaceae bacterium]